MGDSDPDLQECLLVSDEKDPPPEYASHVINTTNNTNILSIFKDHIIDISDMSDLPHDEHHNERHNEHHRRPQLHWVGTMINFLNPIIGFIACGAHLVGHLVYWGFALSWMSQHIEYDEIQSGGGIFIKGSGVALLVSGLGNIVLDIVHKICDHWVTEDDVGYYVWDWVSFALGVFPFLMAAFSSPRHAEPTMHVMESGHEW